MGLFGKKQKAPWKEIYGGAWGHLVSVHHIDVDMLSKEFRCVEKPGTVDGMAVTLLRVFKPKDAEAKGVTITGWETFDEHPELVFFEGHLTIRNQAVLERKRAA